MSGSTFGNIFRVTTWGESHGPAMGAVIDGCPAGLFLSQKDISPFLDRRKPGTCPYSSSRMEPDEVKILSGVWEGKTTGSPISLVISNQDLYPRDYDSLKNIYRPGHGDYTFHKKYGFYDYRGGGRSSGRETVARVAAGAVAMKLLRQLGITITAYTKSIGSVQIKNQEINIEECTENPFHMPNSRAAKKAEALLTELMKKGDSVGGTIECVIDGLPVGLGEPVFDKLDALLGKGMFSVGAVKGVEFGAGFSSSSSYGSQNNDCFFPKHPHIHKKTNHSGGILGGISDGDQIVLRVAIKPTPSISVPQSTVDHAGNPIVLSVKGRHDPIIVPRAVVVIEAMAALTIADALLMNMSSTMEHLETIYKK